MDFAKYISTPKETPEAAPIETDIQLTRGKIWGGFVYFPYGPAGVLHLQIYKGNEQIAPANRGDSYNLDDAVMPLSLDFDLDEPPFVLTARTWNTSTTYDHALNLALFLRETAKEKPKENNKLNARVEKLMAEAKAAKNGLS
jgi:hypothetical protein